MRKSAFTAPAKFKGRCDSCRKEIAVGDMIRCVPYLNGWKRYHATEECSPAASESKATPVQSRESRRRRSYTPRPEPKPERVIEPCRGQTYSRPDQVAVYEYGVYGRSSVLAGQTKRVFLDSFDSVEAAQKAYPDATVSESSRYQAPSLSHLPDGDDMENYEVECLRREQGR